MIIYKNLFKFIKMNKNLQKYINNYKITIKDNTDWLMI